MEVRLGFDLVDLFSVDLLALGLGFDGCAFDLGYLFEVDLVWLYYFGCLLVS